MSLWPDPRNSSDSRKNPKIRIHWKTIKRFKQRVREIAARRRGRSLSQVIDELDQFISGWWNYYGLTESFSGVGGRSC